MSKPNPVAATADSLPRDLAASPEGDDDRENLARRGPRRRCRRLRPVHPGDGHQGLQKDAGQPRRLGAIPDRRRQGRVRHREFWDSWGAIEAFAGQDIEEAFFCSEDDRFLVERDLTVCHYEVAGAERFGELCLTCGKKQPARPSPRTAVTRCLTAGHAGPWCRVRRSDLGDGRGWSWFPSPVTAAARGRMVLANLPGLRSQCGQPRYAMKAQVELCASEEPP